jgi:Uncharacterized protein conserved in bacteria
MSAAWEFLSGGLMMPDDAVIESPIERVFFRCYHYLALGFPVSQRLPIRRQVQIDSYRVDFVIEDASGNRLLAVECDGHDFHERTKEQAARDRSRDRNLLLNHGLPVMRFTGSELYADPFNCAAEALALAMKVAHA